MGMWRAAHVRPLPRGKPEVVGVLDAPRRGQDPSLRRTRERQAVGSGLDRSEQACARAAFPGGGKKIPPLRLKQTCQQFFDSGYPAYPPKYNGPGYAQNDRVYVKPERCGIRAYEQLCNLDHTAACHGQPQRGFDPTPAGRDARQQQNRNGKHEKVHPKDKMPAKRISGAVKIPLTWNETEQILCDLPKWYEI